MLILGLKQDQVVKIGPDVRLVILRTGSGGNQVRIGIEAPKATSITREKDSPATDPTPGPKTPASFSPSNPRQMPRITQAPAGTDVANRRHAG